MMYVAVDIGCIECGERSQCLGIFTDKSRAEAVLLTAKEEQEKNWRGQHSFECFEVGEVQS